MLEGRRIAVVVPAFDEAAWIGETVSTVPVFVDRVVVVDDASSDATAEVARAQGGARTELVQHTENRGVGAAIVSGYRRAREQGAEIVAVMAGDGQMDPDDLEALLAPVLRGQADYVKGDRLAHPEARRMPILRAFGSRTLAFMTARAAGLDHLSDGQCGYTAISAEAIDALDLDAIWPGYGYPNDLLGALAARGLRIREVPVRPVYRGEASGLRPWHAATIAFLVGRVAFRRVVVRRTCVVTTTLER